TITLRDDARQRLGCSCTACPTPCEHVGAALSLILEEKTALGLAVPPPDRTPVESLSEEELMLRALEERKERALKEKFTLRSTEPETLWTDYLVTSAASGKSYCVALRGHAPGESYCSCPDFRKNTLGTCKHILHTLEKVKKRFSAAAMRGAYKRKHIALHIRYAEEAELRLLLPEKIDPKTAALVRPIQDRAINDIHDLLKRVRRLEAQGQEVLIYPDAEEWIDQRLKQDRIASLVSEIRKNPGKHPLRKSLLKTELLPYQLDGIAFAAGAGRAVLADDMGLGKTIQGIGVAELLRRETGIRKALILCPASLKSQWLSEIQRFSGLDCQVVLGSAEARARQYDNNAFFTICNYEQVLRDMMPIEQTGWDLIILDEGQRIKNWEAKTSRIVKGLESPFALVLSGTPLENRLDELYSVVEFIDDRRLGPAFRFFNQHRICNEKGKVLGYKNLDQLRKRLEPILLRRTRASVMRDLPPRMTETLRIPPTDEQLELHAGHMQIAITIANKPFISEMDLMRLQKALLCCRMTADSTFLVDKQAPGYSSKLEALENLLTQLSQEEDRKIVLFSEWTTMLSLIEPCLKKLKMGYVRLDGSVPQKKRQSLVHAFRTDPDCRLFITTNAGSTGLNLQAANTVINVDLPWNPAVLEQRISRAHRMGQKSPVQVFIFITEQTIEENLLSTLSAKHELAQAALDPDSNIDRVDLSCGIDELKQRLEVLLGAKPEAPVDESEKIRLEHQAVARSQQERIASAGGRFLTAAFSLLEELVPHVENSKESERMAALFKERMADFMQKDGEGRPVLTLTLPDTSALDPLANALARIVMMQGESKHGKNGKGRKPVRLEQDAAF
ncbi:MAG: DEAD/DEAH box helicase, partial [Planctomycetota bacterium]